MNATVEQAAKVWRERDAVTEQEIEELRELRAAIASVPIVAAVKALVAMRTGRAEWRRMLPPLVELSGDNQQRMEAVADRLGFLSAPAERAQR